MKDTSATLRDVLGEPLLLAVAEIVRLALFDVTASPLFWQNWIAHHVGGTLQNHQSHFDMRVDEFRVEVKIAKEMPGDKRFYFHQLSGYKGGRVANVDVFVLVLLRQERIIFLVLPAYRLVSTLRHSQNVSLYWPGGGRSLLLNYQIGATDLRDGILRAGSSSNADRTFLHRLFAKS